MIVTSTFYASLTLPQAVAAIKMAYRGSPNNQQDILKKSQELITPSAELAGADTGVRSNAIPVSGTFDIIL